MNYLAHIYLSNENDLVKLGNFMADSIKGNQYKTYDKEIQIGVLLHRNIDFFTDNHPIYRKSKHRLHGDFGHYSGVIMDIFYDHFLAKNWNTYHSTPLENYIQNFYNLLKNNYNILTPNFQNSYPYMLKYNWILQYESIAGLELILKQMDIKTNQKVNMPKSISNLLKDYVVFENEFTLFFKEIIEFVKQKHIELNELYRGT